MDREFKITKKRILAMAEECPEAKAVLKRGFSEAFEDEWKDVTDECKFKVDKNNMGHFIRVYHYGEKISTMDTHTKIINKALYMSFGEISDGYKFVIEDFYGRNFHVLQKQ